MSEEVTGLPDQAMVYTLPRPVPDLVGQILEFTYLLGATLWMGVHASAALLTAPLLARAPLVSLDMGRLLVWLLESLGTVAAVAAGVLLVSILGMHLFRLRRPVTILLMLAIVLTMSVLALGPQIWLMPRIASQLRLAGLQPEGAATEVRAAMLLATRGMGLMGMLHLFFGAMLVALGARRRYRYPQDDLPSLMRPAGP